MKIGLTKSEPITQFLETRINDVEWSAAKDADDVDDERLARKSIDDILMWCGQDIQEALMTTKEESTGKNLWAAQSPWSLFNNWVL